VRAPRWYKLGVRDRVGDAEERLYGGPLDEFASTRRALEREAREAGAAEQANAIKSLAKPTLAAWALNRVSREHCREVDLLLDAGHRLRQAHGNLGASPESVAEARQREREAIAELTDLARALLERETKGASASTVSQVAETLQAAARSEEARERLARGALVRAVRPEAGFGPLPSTGLPDERRRPASRRTPARVRAALAKAERAYEEAREAHEQTTRDVEAAEREAEALRAGLDRATGALESAREDASRAAKALEAARSRLARAREAQAGT
jgi:hypothetical protein